MFVRDLRFWFHTPGPKNSGPTLITGSFHGPGGWLAFGLVRRRLGPDQGVGEDGEEEGLVEKRAVHGWRGEIVEQSSLVERLKLALPDVLALTIICDY